MRARHLILVAVVSLALATAIPTIQTSAVGEEGTGILLVYTTPERTELVGKDDYGRYYVVPGTEYYFTIQGINEYDTDTQITIWAYRQNTEENILITNLEATTKPYDATFTWTIPDYMLDEILKIKYGTNLANDWHYAQEEIWVNARVGDGILKAYDEQTGEELLFAGDENNYLVFPNVEYSFVISEISEYPGQTISVWAFYEVDGTTHNDPIVTGKMQPTITFDWPIPDSIPIGTSIKFKYTNLTSTEEPVGPLPNWYFARREARKAPRLLLVIPGVFLGSIGAMTALFSVLGIKAYLRNKG